MKITAFVFGQKKLSRKELIKSVPHCDEEFKNLRKAVFITSFQRDLIHAKLNSPAVYKKKIFVRVDKLANNRVLLVILANDKHLANLKTILDGFEFECSDENPSKKPDNEHMMIICGVAATRTKTGKDGLPVPAIDKASLKDALHELNELSCQISVLRIYDRAAPFGAIISLDNKADYDGIVETRRLFIKTSTVTAYRYRPTPTCNQCALPGHNAEDCEFVDENCCYKCASSEHTAVDCAEYHEPNRIEFVPCCANCKTRGDHMTRHFATSYYCPFRLDFIDQLFEE